MKIFFLLRQLGHGGAERQAIELIKGFHRLGHEVGVITFYDHGLMDGELRDAGVRLISIGKRGRWDLPGFLFRLACVLRKEKPDFFHGYLPIPNILSSLYKPFMPNARILWGVRASRLDFQHYDWLTWIAYKIETLMSGLADLIIANSHAGRDFAVSKGFPEERIKVIPNGIDTEKFKPDREAGRNFKLEIGVPEKIKVVGVVGRLDPMKGHEVFLRAAAHLVKSKDNLRFVCVGNGPENTKKELAKLTAELGLTDKLVWIEAIDDMNAVYNSFDVLCSPSLFGEGFPNVVGEAMSCGVPCVVTDVGDSNSIVGESGVVVPPNDQVGLSSGLKEMLMKIEDEESFEEACAKL
ncbi:MAG: glycosyltransferase, partial [Nitrospinaceae bacterium]|nr:glycosyltransferase [Nitrospinaceae bacterium]